MDAAMIISLKWGWLREWRNNRRVDLRIPLCISLKPALRELFVVWKWGRSWRVPACNILTPIIGVGCPGSQHLGDGLGCAAFPRRQSESWVNNAQLRWQEGEDRSLNALELGSRLLCRICVASNVDPVWVYRKAEEESGEKFTSWRSLHWPGEPSTVKPMLRMWCRCRACGWPRQDRIDSDVP